MSWQERVGIYYADRCLQLARAQEEQRRKDEMVAERKKLEDEEEIKFRQEKIHPLREALKQLQAEEVLTQIRNEMFPFAEVVSEPDINKISPKTPILAQAVLRATWPCYYAGYDDWSSVHESDLQHSWAPESLEMAKDELPIKAFYSEKGEIIIDVQGVSFPLGLDINQAKASLEKGLIQAVVYFELGVSRSRKQLEENEDVIVKCIARRVSGWENAPAYLLEKARKVKALEEKPKKKPLWQRLLLGTTIS